MIINSDKLLSWKNRSNLKDGSFTAESIRRPLLKYYSLLIVILGLGLVFGLPVLSDCAMLCLTSRWNQAVVIAGSDVQPSVRSRSSELHHFTVPWIRTRSKANSADNVQLWMTSQGQSRHMAIRLGQLTMKQTRRKPQYCTAVKVVVWLLFDRRREI